MENSKTFLKVTSAYQTSLAQVTTGHADITNMVLNTKMRLKKKLGRQLRNVTPYKDFFSYTV
jgi:hypothetical protein